MAIKKFLNSTILKNVTAMSKRLVEAPNVAAPEETPDVLVSYLVVAGGGGGGNIFGGGGAGGYRCGVSGEFSGGGFLAEPLLSFNVQVAYGLTVGAGGDGGALAANVPYNGFTGSDSVLSYIISKGGGGGGVQSTGLNGGSGGGGGAWAGTLRSGGTGTSAQGFQGGSSGSGWDGGGGGGGGAGSAGQNASTSPVRTAGNGGSGVGSRITGELVYRAGGGGGGFYSSGTGGEGGNGGGGNGGTFSGTSGAAGHPNTGGGGGAGSRLYQSVAGGNGGSGVVVIRVGSKFQATFTPGVTFQETAVGSDTVYTVTAAGPTDTVTFSIKPSETLKGVPILYDLQGTDVSKTELGDLATDFVGITKKTNMSKQLEYLVIAGGGGGGTGIRSTTVGGGGGSGGYRSSVIGEFSGGGIDAETPLFVNTSSSDLYSITVGAGGPTYVNGYNSTFSTITSLGGGVGGTDLANIAATGGSGGGGYGRNGAGGSGKPGQAGQGYAGGNGSGSGNSFGGAGGGGASQAGFTGTGSSGGNGGNGLTSLITGQAVTRAGGGGGGTWSGYGTVGIGGSGGGGEGGPTSTGFSGLVNSGSGGGGGGSTGSAAGAGGLGGSGVVILRYPSYLTPTFSPGVTQTTSTVGDNNVSVITAAGPTDTVFFTNPGVYTQFYNTFLRVPQKLVVASGENTGIILRVEAFYTASFTPGVTYTSTVEGKYRVYNITAAGPTDTVTLLSV